MNFERIPPIWLNETDSTNAEAMRLLKHGKPTEGTCIASHFQFQGRGRRSNSWESSAGENLLVSFLLYPPGAIAATPFTLSKTIALAVQQTIHAFSEKKVEIKWPNDILLSGKKAAGILIENQWSGTSWSAAIAGIGINVNQKNFSTGHATSISEGTTELISIDSVLNELQKQLSLYYAILCKGDFTRLDTLYHRHLFGRHDYYTYLTGKTEIRAKVVGVHENGQLELVTQEGTSGCFSMSEVRLLY